jgi:TRAP transporter TAXI family solute receptor
VGTPNSATKKGRRVVTGALLAAVVGVVLLGAMGGCQKPRQALIMGGGPEGGTFQNMANAIASLAGREMPKVSIRVHSSGGSVANLLAVNSGKVALGLVFSGDAYLGRAGRLRPGLPPTTNVRALARLYGASSQLLVHRDSPIHTPFDLRGRRVAVGSFGSGSTASARRYLRQLGLWKQIIPIYVGYAEGVEELKMGEVEAVWFEVGYPNLYLAETSQEIPIRFIDLLPSAVASGFFKRYPFYSPARIPADTYQGQDQDIRTFQDGALLVANAHVDADQVYLLLQGLFSSRGLSALREQLPVAQDIDATKALMGVKIPLHPGAARFWEKRKMALQENLGEK